jgi:hypothetical protein
VDVVAVSLFAVLRGFEIWSQVVPTAAANADGGATLAATAAGSPEHPYVQGARQVLPLPIYALAEIAIVLGAAVATPARPGVWAVIAMGSAAVVELLIGGLRSVVWLTSWALRLLLGITERIIVITATLPSWVAARLARTPVLEEWLGSGTRIAETEDADAEVRRTQARAEQAAAAERRFSRQLSEREESVARATEDRALLQLEVRRATTERATLQSDVAQALAVQAEQQSLEAQRRLEEMQEDARKALEEARRAASSLQDLEGLSDPEE